MNSPLNCISTLLIVLVMLSDFCIAANDDIAQQQVEEERINEIVKSYAEKHVQLYLVAHQGLIDQLETVNIEREQWKPYSNRWKAWYPHEVEMNNPSYDYAEYIWSARRDRSFRNQHTRSVVAQELRDFSESTDGIILELFVVDCRGGNVALASWTTDWFQGDEAKFQKPFESLEIEVFPPSRDDTVGKMVVQASIPMFRADDTLLGVAVVSLDVDRLLASKR
ncbi:PDC sensor domain-containing protein [Stieleria sp. JC731]|uniref:PDC sensor domain-containing protein n=1 Tax=Pirellulaceae TaxID=2691357 RepID=UPI001E4E3782|nr:PDC sensor domain-containing protein [Stieleria sp. JC731]MCC9603586.1 PDC sensor domain-containing protein [Stieleria sp. JC731]